MNVRWMRERDSVGIITTGIADTVEQRRKSMELFKWLRRKLFECGAA